MANFSRALLNLGEGLGNVAQSVAQREIENMRELREQNLMRLGAQYREQADVAQFGRQKELVTMQEGIGERSEGRRQAFDVGMAARREQHDVTLAGRQESFQRERFGREDLQSTERTYATQLAEIDDRIAKLKDDETKLLAQAQAKGGELNPRLFSGSRLEREQLKKQKGLLVTQRDEHLAQLGDKRYAKVTPEEVEKERRAAASGSPPFRDPNEVDPVTLKTRAQLEAELDRWDRSDKKPKPAGMVERAKAALRSDDVPAAPPKPQGMIDREKRRERRVAPETTRLSPVEQALAPLKQSGVDFKRSEYVQHGRERRTILEAQSRPQLEGLLRTGDLTRGERAMIREILAEKGRAETRRRLEEFKAR